MNEKYSMKVGILTSGGDAPGMNAAIRAIVLAAAKENITVYGFYHGYNGLLEGDYRILSVTDVNDIIHLGGTIIKSARCKEMHDESGVHKAVKQLETLDLDGLIIIGGDGSFMGMNEISNHWQGQCIGIPATIDNDIALTDHTIGFATAINTAIRAIDKIRDTANAFDRLFLIELMGRHSGHIAFHTGIATAAEKVMSFENTLIDDTEHELDKLKKQILKHKENQEHSFIIVIAENLWPSGSVTLANQIKEYTGIDCTLCTLGHVQRGGSPVAKDRIAATKMGVASIKYLKDGLNNVFTAENGNTIAPVSIEDMTNSESTVSTNLIDAYENMMIIDTSAEI